MIGFRAHPKSRMPSSRDPKLISSAKTLFPSKEHSEAPDGHELGGDTINPPHPPTLKPVNVNIEVR